MHRVKGLLGLSLLGLMLFSGCEIINPAEELPAYVSIREPAVVLNEATGFSSQAGLRNIWLYHGGFFQGAYPMDPQEFPNGRVVPVLDLAQQDFFLEGGIYESGLSSFQIPYPFWDRVSAVWQGTVGDTLYLEPQFHYVDDSRYDTPVVVNFDGGSFDLVPFGASVGENGVGTFIKLSNVDVFQGTGCGTVHLSADTSLFEAINEVGFTSRQDQNIFAEITYKSTVPFSVGLIYESASGIGRKSIVTVNPSPDWNTIYVHLIAEVRELVNTQGANTLFWLWLSADSEGQAGDIRFDDIRVIREP